jgi:hypothetical protein
MRMYNFTVVCVTEVLKMEITALVQPWAVMAVALLVSCYILYGRHKPGPAAPAAGASAAAAPPPYVMWLEETAAADVSQVGGKASNLGKLLAAGFQVPHGFCVSARAFTEQLGAMGLLSEVEDLFSCTGSAAGAGEVRERLASLRLAVAGLADEGELIPALQASCPRPRPKPSAA